MGKLLLILTFILFGCSKADYELSILSSTLSQLSTDGSPYDYDIQTGPQHSIIKGSCPTLVNTLEIKFDELNWVMIGATPAAPTGGEAPPSGLVYDVDCSDGHFLFWVYNHELSSFGTTDPYKISLRGRGTSVETVPTVYWSPKYLPPVSRFDFYKFGAPNGARAISCVEIHIDLRNEYGGAAQHYLPISVSIDRTINGVSNNSYSLYNSDSDCVSEISPVSPSSISIPKDNTNMTFFYKTSDIIDDEIKLQLNVAGFDTDPNGIKFKIRNDNDMYLDFMTPWRVLAGQCYPVSVFLHKYNNSSVTGNHTFITFPSKPAEVEFFTSPSCVSAVTGFSMDYVDQMSFYMRVNASGNNMGLIKVAATDPSATFFDGEGRYINYDNDVSNSAIASYQVNAPATVYIPGNYGINIWAVNSSGTPVPTNTTLSLNFSGSTGGFQICDGGTCGISSFNFGGSFQKFLNLNPSTAGTAEIQLLEGGTPKGSFVIDIQN